MREPRHRYMDRYVVLPRMKVFSPELVVGLMLRFQLTKRHAELAAMLAEGVELVAVGAVFGLTESSVRTFAKQLYAHLGVHTQAQVVAVVYKAIMEARDATAFETQHKAA